MDGFRWTALIAGLALVVLAPRAARSASDTFAGDLQSYCLKDFEIPPGAKPETARLLCPAFQLEKECMSAQGLPIPHYEKKGSDGVRILVFGQIHGDESDASRLAYDWIERLSGLSPKNTWRVVPRLNPDGHRLNTRANANGVDLNRNFPTRDWDVEAIKVWKKHEHSNVRRYPGAKGGSEIETRCVLKQIESFQPDVVVSIHTPYAVLDLDGMRPKNAPGFSLPWHSLGTFPGSLGRYLWTERKVPVLTIELAESSLKNHRASFDRLQDYVSFLAMPKH